MYALAVGTLRSLHDAQIAQDNPFFSLASLHLLRLQWATWESKWVDPLDPRNSDAEYDTDLEEAAATYGLDDDDPYGMR